MTAQAPKKGPKEYDEDDKAFLEKKKVGAGALGCVAQAGSGLSSSWVLGACYWIVHPALCSLLAV